MRQGSQGAHRKGWGLKEPGVRAGVSGPGERPWGEQVQNPPTPLPPQHAKSPKTPFLQTGFSPHSSGVCCVQRSPGPENSPMWVERRPSEEEVWAGQSPQGSHHVSEEGWSSDGLDRAEIAM